MERFVLFSCNKQSFALDISKVEKIIEFTAPNPIPESSDYLQGVIQYNDRILPIINLSKRLYNIDSSYDTNSKVIVVIWKDTLVGFVVDEIYGIRGYEDGQIEESAMDSNISKQYVQGFIKTDKEIIIVIDTDKIFNPAQEQELLSTTDLQTESTI
jgi:purine-binding chemotaxis protein CheW